MSDIDPKPDCTKAAHELHVYLDGELTEESRRTIQAHLDKCPPCHDAFDFEAELRRVLADRLHRRVPSDLADRIRRAIEHERAT